MHAVSQCTAVPTSDVDNNSLLLASQSDAPNISNEEKTLQQEVNSSDEEFKTEKSSPLQDDAPISEEISQQEILNSSGDEVKYSNDDDDIESQTDDIEEEVVTCLIL